MLHTGDWHLGRIFHGRHLIEDQVYVLDQFVRLVGDTKPDVVLLAGDVYDRSVPPTEAVKLLDEVLSRVIRDYRVQVVMIAGNHDSPERLEFAQRLLASQGLHVTGVPGEGSGPLVLYDAYGPVYFCPIPYAEPPVVRERMGTPEAVDHELAMAVLLRRLTSSIPPGGRTVIVTHAFVAGGEKSESERPLLVGKAGTVSSSHFQPFQYTALGHLHRPQKAGAEHIRYAGSLLKYSFSEASHHKSVTLVEMDAAGRTSCELIPLTPRRDVRCLTGYLQEILAGTHQAGNREDYLMVTLLDTGAILDAMGRLREVYPNTLHIERPYLAAAGDLRCPSGDHRRVDEKALFASFYEQVTASALSPEEEKVFGEIMEELWRQEREVGE